MNTGKWVMFITCLLLGFSAAAQTVLEQKVTIRLKAVLLEDALQELVTNHNIRLSYSNDILPPIKVTLQVNKRNLQEVLNQLLRDTDIAYQEVGQQIVLYKKTPPPSIPAERKYTISGFVEDTETGERLIAANVVDRMSGKGTETNEYGFFSLTLPAGDVQLYVFYVGYESAIRAFQLQSNRRLKITLKSSLQLPEIEVIARDSITTGLRSGSTTDYFNANDIERLPRLAGEADLFRALHLMPGVQTGTDGLGGLHVRGGNPEHNLILIDGVPVYNAAHAAGLFSIFNTDAIRSARLIKGGFPARYGGRLSSVLDVHTREGNLRQFSGQAEIGLLTARASLEGPFVRDKSSFFVSARRSLMNWYLEPLASKYKSNKGEIGSTSYEFFDLNAKLNYALSDKDKLYVSFYRGADHFTNRGLRSDSINFYSSTFEDTLHFRHDSWYRENLDWGNTIGAIRWNHLFSDRLFSNITFTFSRFATDIYYGSMDSLVFTNVNRTLYRTLEQGRYLSGIRDLGARADFDWLLNPTHTLHFGVHATQHRFKPGALTVNDHTEQINQPENLGNDPINSFEYNVYIEDNILLSNQLIINVGVHAARLQVQKKVYNSLQPRLSAYWNASDRLGFRASYGQMVQFLHLLSNSNIGLPTDLWVPATAHVPPQRAWQASLGAEYRLGWAQASIEGYYKRMDHLINYTEGALFLNDWENNVTFGNGRAYGIEMLLRRSQGKATGWVSYGLAWADRRFDLINFGNRYPFQFDRRHDLKIAAQYVPSDWLRLSASWVINSGFAFTLPLLEYYYQTEDGVLIPVLDYGSKNQYRMPFYHRLDVNAQMIFRMKYFTHSINIGAYNIYDRRNPLYYDLRTRFINDENDQLREVKEFVQVWLLPFLPSLSYSIQF
jgi:hypothetical protein